MSEQQENDNVRELADAIKADDGFKAMLADTVKSALNDSLKPAENKAAGLFAPANQTRKREASNVFGGVIAMIAKGKGDRERAVQHSKALYGDESPVTKALLETGADTAGGSFVQDTVAAEVIEALRPASVIRSLGPRIVPNPTGTISIPRFDTGAGITWAAEATGTNATQQVTGNVTLNWRKGIIKVPVTKELVMHSSPDIEQAVSDDVIGAMAQGTDAAYIRGAAASDNPTGIRFQLAGANAIAANATVNATNVEDDLRKAMQAVLGNNRSVNSETGAWLMSTRSYLFLMNLRDANGNLIFPELRNADPRMYTYRVRVTNNIPDNLGGGTDESEVYFGHVPSLMIADATNFSIEVLENVAFLDSTGSLRSGVDTDEVLVKSVVRTDIALRHTIAWSVLTAVTWGA